eukprot:1299866-Prymnesium_polylepis.1
MGSTPSKRSTKPSGMRITVGEGVRLSMAARSCANGGLGGVAGGAGDTGGLGGSEGWGGGDGLSDEGVATVAQDAALPQGPWASPAQHWIPCPSSGGEPSATPTQPSVAVTEAKQRLFHSPPHVQQKEAIMPTSGHHVEVQSSAVRQGVTDDGADGGEVAAQAAASPHGPCAAPL